ncbi:MAG: hypothetical protein ACREFR_17435 [Limisphaerales bacterium]
MDADHVAAIDSVTQTALSAALAAASVEIRTHFKVF